MNSRQISSKKRFLVNRELWFYIIMLAFPVTQFCVFYIGVNLNSVLLAFKSYNNTSGRYSFVGAENFRQVFAAIGGNTLTQVAIRNSSILFILGLAVGTVLALLFSYYFYKKKIGSEIFRVFLLLPSVLPSIVLVIMFSFFSDDALPAILSRGLNMDINGLLANPDSRLGTIFFYNIWIGFGTQILLYRGAMSQIDPSLEEACRVDGGGAIIEFVHIVIPQIFATLVTFILTAIAGLFINQANLYSFYGETASGKVQTIGYILFVPVAKNEFSLFPYTAAFGLMCTMVVVPLSFCTKYFMEKYGPRD